MLCLVLMLHFCAEHCKHAQKIFFNLISFNLWHLHVYSVGTFTKIHGELALYLQMETIITGELAFANDMFYVYCTYKKYSLISTHQFVSHDQILVLTP